jgi:hypothetical protein
MNNNSKHIDSTKAMVKISSLHYFMQSLTTTTKDVKRKFENFSKAFNKEIEK